MQNRTLANRYAQTLLKADPTGAVEPQVTLLRQVLQLAGVTQALSNPRSSTTEKVQAISKAFGKQQGELLQSFIALVARKGRLDLLADIAESYLSLQERAKGIRKGTVISAIALDSSQLKRIESKFSGQTGLKYQFEQIVDKRLIGGFKIQIDDTVYDWSLQTQLQTLRQRFMTLAG